MSHHSSRMESIAEDPGATATVENVHNSVDDVFGESEDSDNRFKQSSGFDRKRLLRHSTRSYRHKRQWSTASLKSRDPSTRRTTLSFSDIPQARGTGWNH